MNLLDLTFQQRFSHASDGLSSQISLSENVFVGIFSLIELGRVVTPAALLCVTLDPG